MTWDENNNGVLEADEFIAAMINFGLAPNLQFATKLLQVLDHRSGGKDVKDLKITLNDWIKIFRSNNSSESLLNMINRETEKKFKSNNKKNFVNK